MWTCHPLRRTRQTWFINGTRIFSKSVPRSCLWFKDMAVRQTLLSKNSSWMATTSPCSDVPPLSQILELRRCSAADLCLGRGTAIPNMCKCICHAPWHGQLCLEVDPKRKGRLSCEDKRKIGPAGEMTLRHVWVTMRLEARSSIILLMRLIREQATNTFLGMKILFTIPCVALVCLGCGRIRLANANNPVTDATRHQVNPALFGHRELTDAEITFILLRNATAVWVMYSAVAILISFAFIIVICLLRFVFVLAGVVLNLAFLWASFPVYAQLNKHRWPHADRAILVCFGETAISSYVLVPNLVQRILDLQDIVKASAVPLVLQGDYSVLGVSTGLSNGMKIVFAEIANAYSMVGLVTQVIVGGQLLPSICVSLLGVTQIVEIMSLSWFSRKKNWPAFQKAEAVFLWCQDLPQLVFISLCIAAKLVPSQHMLRAFVISEGSINQYELYNLLSSLCFVFLQVARICNPPPEFLANELGGESYSGMRIDDGAVELAEATPNKNEDGEPASPE